MSNYYMKQIADKPLEFKYMLLGRLQMDCKYYLGNGGGNPDHLFMQNEFQQFRLMVDIYNDLEVKPEWLTLADILDFRTKMEMIAIQNELM